MKICIYTFSYGQNCNKKADITNPFKVAYCQLYGYDFIYYNPPICSEKRPMWKKIECSIELLPLYDYIMWVDADAAPVDFSRHIEDWIIPYKNLIIARDVVRWGENQDYFNSGAFILKNTDWTMQMLYEWKRRGKLVKRSRALQDQPELNDMYVENYYNMQSKTYVWPSSTFQSVNGGHYKKGIFIKHIAHTAIEKFHKTWWEKLLETDFVKYGISKKTGQN